MQLTWLRNQRLNFNKINHTFLHVYWHSSELVTEIASVRGGVMLRIFCKESREDFE